MRKRGYKSFVLPLIAERDKTYICSYGEWKRLKGEQLRAGILHLEPIYEVVELEELVVIPSVNLILMGGDRCGSLSTVVPRRAGWPSLSERHE